MEIKQQVKILLGFENTSEHDGIIDIITEDAVNAVCAYCRLEVVPYTLESIIAMIAADSFRRQQWGSADTAQAVKSVSEGGRAVTYGDVSADSFLSSWKARLKPFVNLRGRVPSELQ